MPNINPFTTSARISGQSDARSLTPVPENPAWEIDICMLTFRGPLRLYFSIYSTGTWSKFELNVVLRNPVFILNIPCVDAKYFEKDQIISVPCHLFTRWRRSRPMSHRNLGLFFLINLIFVQLFSIF